MDVLILQEEGAETPTLVAARVENANEDVMAGSYPGWEVLGIFPLVDSIDALRQKLASVETSAQHQRT